MKDKITLYREALTWIKIHPEHISSIEHFKGGERVQRILNILHEARLLDNVKVRSKDAGKAAQLRQRGNELYKSQKVSEALTSYTESLFMAPLNSPEYYLALSNRSAAFFYLEHFSSAMEDAESALSLLKGERPDLREKLENRIRKCRELTKNSNTKPKIDPKAICPYFEIKDKRHPKIPCASDKIKLEVDDEYGRKVVAAADMDPGHVIAIEGPYIKRMSLHKRFSRCAYCLSQNLALKPCPGCVETGFCSDRCRSLAEWHKYECPIVDRLVEMQFDANELSSLRIVCQARCQFSSWKELQNVSDAEDSQLQDPNRDIDNTYGSIHRLKVNESRQSCNELFEICVTAAVFLYLLKSETTFFGDWKEADAEKLIASLLSRHIMASATNLRGFWDLQFDNFNEMNDVELYGNGIFPFLSMLNHSCSPNVFVVLIGIIHVAIINRPVKKGDQLFESYGYLHTQDSKLYRKNRLFNTHKFHCKCEACANDWPTVSLLPLAPITIHLEYYQRLLKGNIENMLKIIPSLYSDAKLLERFHPSLQGTLVGKFIAQVFVIFAFNIKPEDLNQ